MWDLLTKNDTAVNLIYLSFCMRDKLFNRKYNDNR